MIRTILMSLAPRLAVSLALVGASLALGAERGPAGIGLVVFAGGAAVSYPLGWPSLPTRILASLATSLVVSAGAVGLVIAAGIPLRPTEVILATGVLIVVAALIRAILGRREKQTFAPFEIGVQAVAALLAAGAVLVIR